jgi:hypothetical protein
MPAVQQELASMRTVQQQLEALYSWPTLQWLWSSLLPHAPPANVQEAELMFLEKIIQQLNGKGDYPWNLQLTLAAVELLTAYVETNRCGQPYLALWLKQWYSCPIYLQEHLLQYEDLKRAST